MDDQEHARYHAELQARMNRMEAMMQQLLGILTTSHDSIGQNTQLKNLLQELHNSPDIQARRAAGFTAGVFPQQQERPEIKAIREALLAGDKMRAIKLYRSLYGVDFATAQAALDAM